MTSVFPPSFVHLWPPSPLLNFHSMIVFVRKMHLLLLSSLLLLSLLSSSLILLLLLSLLWLLFRRLYLTGDVMSLYPFIQASLEWAFSELVFFDVPIWNQHKNIAFNRAGSRDYVVALYGWRLCRRRKF